MRILALMLSAVMSAMLTIAPTLAQQTTGTPGSPDATTTIDGKYLPPPPQKFGGQIGLQASQSKPYWPARVVPPQGAPNILLIMTDDQGYGVSGTFKLAPVQLNIGSSGTPGPTRITNSQKSPADPRLRGSRNRDEDQNDGSMTRGRWSNAQ